MLRDLIFSKKFCESHKKRKEYFTRERIFNFSGLMLFQMNIASKSLTVELTRFFKRISGNTQEKNGSKQSYSDARMKMSYQAYVELNDRFVSAYYADDDYQRWKGYRLIAIDGSRIQLPSTPAMIEEFGIAENKGKSIPMAMTSPAYDVLNHLVINTYLARYEASERALAEQHVERIKELTPKSKDILLLDRGYPSLYLCTKMLVNGYNFVIRCNAENFLNEVKEFAKSATTDQIIEIDVTKSTRKHSPELQALLRNHSLATIRLRIVKIVLSSGVTEYLLTSLLDQQQISDDDLKNIYHLRWNEETYFNFQKNVLEIENFSGKTPEAIRQDYYARVLSTNVNSLLIQEAQQEVDRETQQSEHRQYENYGINKTVATGILKDEVIEMLFAPREHWKQRYQSLVASIKRYIIPKIPGRSFARKEKIPNKSFLKRRKAI